MYVADMHISVYAQRFSSFVLGLGITEPLPGGRKLAQFVAHHVFRNLDRYVLLTVVNLELEPHELRQNRGGPCICSYRSALRHGVPYGERYDVRTLPHRP